MTKYLESESDNEEDTDEDLEGGNEGMLSDAEEDNWFQLFDKKRLSNQTIISFRW